MKFQRTCWRLVNIGLTSFLRLLMYSDHRKIPILYLEKNNFMRICLCWQWKHALQRKERRLVKVYLKGPSIKYVRKIFRKTNISNPLIRTCSVRIRGLEMLVFRKILGMYWMDNPQVMNFHSKWWIKFMLPSHDQ